MPIFQPTNIIPSSFAGIGGGTVDVNRSIYISWQVNGNTPLTAFTITIQENNTDSTLVRTVTINSTPTGGSELPFSGTDEKGNAVFYVFNPLYTWSNWGLVNGKSYKMSIAQVGADGSTVEQYSPSVFITRATPSVSIQPTLPQVDGVSYTFNGVYSQAQNDAMNWCRWQLAVLQSDGQRRIIRDTGEIFTSVLSFTYNGFLTNTSYSVMLDVETQNGVQASTGWVDFSVNYDVVEDNTPLQVSCSNDSSNQIEVKSSILVQGEPSPESGYGEITNGSLVLNRGASVTFDQKADGSSLSIPFKGFIWKGDSTSLREALNTGNEIGKVYYQEIVYNSSGDAAYLIAACGDPLVLKTYAIFINSNYETSFSPLYEYDVSSILNGMDGFSITVNPSGTLLVVSDTYGVYYSTLTNGQIVGLTELNDSRYTAGINFVRFIGDTCLIVGGTVVGTDIYTVSGTTIGSYSSLTDSASDQVNSMCISYIYNAGGSTVFLGLSSQKGLFCGFKLSSSGVVSSFSYFENSETSTTGSYLCSNIAANAADGLSMLIVGGIYSDYQNGVFLEPILKTYSFTSATNPFTVTEQVNMLTNTAYQDYLIKPIQASNSWSFSSYVGGLFSSGEAMFEVDYTTFGLRQMYRIPAASGGISDAYIGNPSKFYFLKSDLRAYEGFILGGDGSHCYDFNLNNRTIATLNVGTSSWKIVLSPTDLTISYGASSKQIPISGAKLAVVIKSGVSYYLEYAYWDENVDPALIDASIPIPSGDVSVSSLVLSGDQTCAFFGILKGSPFNLTNSMVVSSSVNPSYYYLYTDFASGSLSAIIPTQGFLYRLENGVLKLISYVPDSLGYVKDFGVKSNTTVSYLLVSKNENVYMAPLPSAEICRSFNGYYLIEASPSQTQENVYEAVNVWKFGNNISAGSVSNNNAPNFITNFTPYRYPQKTSRMGRSGTLQALLSNVQNCAYADTAAQMDALYALSKTPNSLFLKDMKGNLYMISISGPIVQTINTKSFAQEVTVSIPWEETGNAEDVSIIQLPQSE